MNYRMSYYEMWERLKEEICRALDEGRDCGYDDPSSENYGKFYVYDRVFKKIENLEKLRKEK